MPLSEHEQRLLNQIEKVLYTDAPRGAKIGGYSGWRRRLYDSTHCWSTADLGWAGGVGLAVVFVLGFVGPAAEAGSPRFAPSMMLVWGLLSSIIAQAATLTVRRLDAKNRSAKPGLARSLWTAAQMSAVIFAALTASAILCWVLLVG